LIAKIHDINELLARGRVEPDAVFPELKRLAASDRLPVGRHDSHDGAMTIALIP
jgi:hypothetical protein